MEQCNSKRSGIDPMYEKYLINQKYSSYQMYNFYEKLSCGEVSMNDIMNLMQHFYVADQCYENAKVLDVCCGRALIVPLLCKRNKSIKEYVGLDISQENLTEAQKLINNLNCDIAFKYGFLLRDITEYDESLRGYFDIIIYTSSIEHMGKKEGIKSLQNIYKYLKDDGVLYLSTPNTQPNMPNQYRCHVYEWDYSEISDVINNEGMLVIDCIGLLPPSVEILKNEIRKKYGDNAVNWFEAISKKMPKEFWGPIMALDFTNIAKEMMFICKKRGKNGMVNRNWDN